MRTSRLAWLLALLLVPAFAGAGPSTVLGHPSWLASVLGSTVSTPPVAAQAAAFLPAPSGLTAQTLFATPNASGSVELTASALIVRLRPSPAAPRAAEVVDAVNRGQPVPGGLWYGGPRSARFLIPARLQGHVEEFYEANPDLPRARLQRSVVMSYPSAEIAADALQRLRNDPFVEFVEFDLPLTLPVFGDSDLAHGESAQVDIPPDASVLQSTPALQGTCEPAVGVIPNDALFAPSGGVCDKTTYQWGSYAMRLPEAWEYVRGHAKVQLIDVGIDAEHPDLKPFGLDGVQDDWFLGGNYRPHLSYQYFSGQCDASEYDAADVHGSHVAGIVGATPNNGRGVAGACWHCPLLMGNIRPGSLSTAVDAINGAAARGVQITSISFGEMDECPGGSGGGIAICEALDLIANREIVIVGASGNDLVEVELPANATNVVSAGGINTSGAHWDRLADPTGNCLPAEGVATYECGSNYSLDPQNRSLDLVAPAQFVLSTVREGLGYETASVSTDDNGCGDAYPDDGLSGNDTDGYGSCTGTSMASPYAAGVLSLLRTANPLLTRWQLRQVLLETASGVVEWDQKLGYGLPDAAEAVRSVQGTVDGQVLANRITPMFQLVSTDGHATHLFTTAPQAAVNEVEADGGFQSAPEADAVLGYPQFPGPMSVQPRASFWLFTGPTDPDPAGDPLVPLYRLTRDRFQESGFCGDEVTPETKRSFGYAVNAGEVTVFHRTSTFIDEVRYFPEGIEGYIYSPTATPPTGAERLYRYYDDVRDDWLLLLESEAAPASYNDSLYSSNTSPNGEFVGWVLPNVDTDSDGLVDAWEEILGTNSFAADTDGDLYGDGQELLGFWDPTQWRLSDPLDPQSPPTIFADGFESGDTTAWN